MEEGQEDEGPRLKSRSDARLVGSSETLVAMTWESTVDKWRGKQRRQGNGIAMLNFDTCRTTGE